MTGTRPADLLRQHDFRRYWMGAGISLTGDAVAVVALPLTAVTVLGAGPGALGTLTALAWLPSLLLGVPAGIWVDGRRSPRRVMLAADVARALLLVSVPVEGLLGRLTLPHLYAVAFGLGALSVPADVAAPRLFVQLVPPASSVAGAQLLNGARAGAGVLGQACGGTLVALLTAPVALLADVASYLASAFALRGVPDPRTQFSRPSDPAVRGGQRILLRCAPVRLMLGAAVTLNAFTTMSSALLPLFATRVLGLGPGAYGAALAVGAAGGLVGALVAGPVAARVGVGRALAVGAVLFPAPFGLLALGSYHGGAAAWIALAAAELVASLGVLLFDVAGGAVRACAVPAAAQGRVSGAFQTVNFGVRPLGALVGGLLGEAVGLRAVLLLAAVGGTLSVLWALRPALREFRVPDATPPQPSTPGAPVPIAVGGDEALTRSP